jgi:pilus assembly protein CpaF
MPQRPNDDLSNNGHRPDPISPIVPGRAGRPSFSLEALRERIEHQFQDETANRIDILTELDTDEKRRALLREVADYVLAVESVTLSERERQTILDKAYSNLFTFGPLEAYLRDDTVTEITVNGPADIHVRHGLGALHSVPVAFDDRVHLEDLIKRVLATAQVTPPENDPFLEVGVTLLGRSARLVLAAPPVSPEYSLEIRLHPRTPITLDDLYARFETLPPQAAALLNAILAAEQGLLIVGDVGQGKTTLAGALAQTLPTEMMIVAVERASELALPPIVTCRPVIPPSPTQPGRDFASQFRAGLDERPLWLIADEIRGDEAAAVWEALRREEAPHYLWVFRGDPQPDRLRSAINMLIRRTQPAIAQGDINRALLKHLPFVVALRRTADGPRLGQIAEWTPGATDDDPLTLRPLLLYQDSAWTLTGERPAHALPLPDEFWR